MDCDQVLLSKEQVREIARSIYGDIAEYIQAHQEEYKEFLLCENPEADK